MQIQMGISVRLLCERSPLEGIWIDLLPEAVQMSEYYTNLKT